MQVATHLQVHKQVLAFIRLKLNVSQRNNLILDETLSSIGSAVSRLGVGSSRWRQSRGGGLSPLAIPHFNHCLTDVYLYYRPSGWVGDVETIVIQSDACVGGPWFIQKSNFVSAIHGSHFHCRVACRHPVHQLVCKRTSLVTRQSK